ncbi:MAG: LysR family transcriptional regulator [Proteobacteria bacterium]|nr:LysR family transcriptional regulator [Pseudomonadota bacterium]
MADELNLSRAAGRLHLSQPALSQLIHSLEAELGGPLFERHARGVTLSQAGAVFKAEAFELVSRYDQALARTRRVTHGDAGRLHVGFNELSGQHRLFAESVARFRKAFPDVALEIIPLTAHEQIGLLRSASIDAGFQYRHHEEPDFITHLSLEPDYYMLAIAKDHPLAALDHIDAKALSSTTLIRVMRTANPPLHDRITHHIASLGISPVETLETGSDVATMNLVAVGMGVGVVQAGRQTDAMKNIVFCNLPGPRLATHLVLVWRPDRRTPQLDNFIKVVGSVARKPRNAAGSASERR